MKPQIKRHQNDTLVSCLLCHKIIDLGLNYKVGKFITCKNCEMVYEIINIDPVMIDWPYFDNDDMYDDFEDDLFD